MRHGDLSKIARFRAVMTKDHVSRGNHRRRRIGTGAAHGAGTHAKQIIVRCPHDSRTKTTRRSCARGQVHESRKKCIVILRKRGPRRDRGLSMDFRFREDDDFSKRSTTPKKEPRLSPGLSDHSPQWPVHAGRWIDPWIRTSGSSCRCNRYRSPSCRSRAGARCRSALRSTG
jgi:hypothetical protein